MKYLAILLVTICVTVYGTAQTNNTKNDVELNLGFEKSENNLPSGWIIPSSDQYKMSIDTTEKFEGNHSIKISFVGDQPAGTGLMFRLPHNYNGQELTLSGYLKTDKITDGIASLLISIPKVNFVNMEEQKVSGTSDWKKYEVSIQLDPAKTKDIFVGGMLSGKGTLWLDDLTVSIDGKPLSEAQIFKEKEYPADRDTAYKDGSGITAISMDKQTLDNLNVLGLVWGYLKFYHPSVAAGNYNWTNTLFRLLPRVAAAKNDAARDAILSDFITKLGPFKSDGHNLESSDKDPVKLNTDTSWFSKTGISAKLSGQLRAIYSADREPASYYYGFEPAGNVNFPHESAFTYLKTEDVGGRLLALYSYWNAIEYFFPYRYLIKDWQKVLTDYIPVMIQADTRLKYEMALNAVIAKIEDTHGGLNGNTAATNAYYGALSPAIGVTFIQDKWVVNRYVDSIKGPQTGIEIGDVLEKVDGRPVDEIVESLLDLISASNTAAKYRIISWTLLRTHKDSVKLVISREGHQITKTVKTFNANTLKTIEFADKSKPSFQQLNADIAYIYPGTIKNSEVDEIMQKAAASKGLIIDLRCYPSAFIVFNLGAKLTGQPVNFVKFASVDHLYPGKIIMSKPLPVGQNNSHPYKGRVVLLVNEYTQSQAEYTAMAFRATGATVIGSTTAGADGNVSSLVLPGGLSTSFSGLGVYYPDGTETQRVGIVPDIECKPTIKGIKEGTDEVLDRAVRYIESGK